MQIKTEPPIRVMYARQRTTLSQLGTLSNVARELYSEAVQKGAFISGPLYWVYHGMDGKADTAFMLDIAVPVQGNISSEKFGIKEMESFKSVAHTHQGPWDKMPLTYESILAYIDEHKFPINEEYREVYWNIDLVNPENNRVEMQMGIV